MSEKKYYKKLNIGNIDTCVSLFPKKEDKIYAHIFVKAGTCFMPSGKKFVPHLLEHAIANKLMKNELDYGASTDIEYLTFYFSSKKKDFMNHFEIFMNSIISQDYPIDDFKNEKMAIINELSDDGIKLESRTFTDLSRIRYDSFVYAKDEFNAKDIKASKIAEIKSLQKNFFVGENIKLFISAREFDQEKIDKIKQIILALDVQKGIETVFPAPGEYSKKCYVKKQYDSPKAHLVLTWPCPAFSQSLEDRIGINFLRELLTSGSKSVLFKKLRLENSFIYNIESHTIMYSKVAVMTIYVTVEKKNIGQTIEIIKDSIDEIKHGRVNKEFMKENIDDYIDSNKKEWDSNERLNWIMGDLVDFGKVVDANEINKINKTINADFLAKVAKKYLDHEYLNIIEYSK